MSSLASISRTAGFAALSLSCALAYADGSGTIDDTHNAVDPYTSEAYIVPNMTGFAAGTDTLVCEPGTPTCDIYTLTINVSDEFRALQPDAFVDISVGWTDIFTVPGQAGVPDYDVFLYDSKGNILTEAATTDDPEVISLPLDVMENGTYEIRVIPFQPAGEPFTLNAGLSGLVPVDGGKGLGILGAGSLGLSLLLPLGLMGFGRRRQH